MNAPTGAKHRLLQAGVFLFVFLLITAGRWFDTAESLQVLHADLGVLLVAIGYGSLSAGIAFFIVDLVRAHGLLQRKLLFIKTLFILLLAMILADRIVDLSSAGAAISLLLCLVLTGTLILADVLQGSGTQLRRAESDRLPRHYLHRRPLKGIFQTLLRLLPFPGPVGLYRIGSPGENSPLLVTGNFELTLRRVSLALEGLDCWLLVCDSRGVNIWCASMAGHFTTASIVQAVKSTNLVQLLSRRQLILPQLCASSISLEELKSQTGFSALFGPVYIRDIRRYLTHPGDTAIRKVQFPLNARLEMALGTPLLLTVVLILVFNFMGPYHLCFLLPMLYIASLVNGLIFPRRPHLRIGVWALLYGAFFSLLAGLFAQVLFSSRVLLYALTVGIGAAYLVTEFSGWSPLLKYSLIPYKRPEVSVDDKSCVGCGRCVQVCPLAVFRMESGRSVVVGGERCVICRSCFSQCPSGAVLHSHADWSVPPNP